MSKPPHSISYADQGQWRAGAARSGAEPGTAGGRWQQVAPVVWSDAERTELENEFNAVLARGVHGLCFSPYLEGQAPGSVVSEAQIRKRLQIIKPHTGWVRTFSCTDGHQHTPRNSA
jgi:glucan 1,3-beta-glucosidase